MAPTVHSLLTKFDIREGKQSMIRADQPYTSAKPKDGSSLASFFIWAVIWIAVLAALLPR